MGRIHDTLQRKPLHNLKMLALNRPISAGCAKLILPCATASYMILLMPQYPTADSLPEHEKNQKF